MFHAINTITQTNTYVEEYSHWKKGDVRKNVWRSHFTAATPGGEGTIGFAYRLSSSVSLGITGRLILISKIQDVTEYTDYYKTDWDPAQPELIIMKYGEEYGGMGWGIGASLIF